METHVVPFDGWPYADGSQRARCGQVVSGLEIVVVDPSCPICRQLDDENEGKSADEMFGTDAEIRQYGPTVTTRFGDPLAGYTPKEPKR
jgi:hypothetical protein